MVNSLIRGKQFYKNRLLGKYWRVIIDGTGMFYFKERHCKNCLRTTRIDEKGNKVKYYYHKVVEAKPVLGEKNMISPDTEFIENENKNVGKQDCEINAAKRLLNSKNSNAMKNHDLLTQLSDIIMQLYLARDPFIRKMGQSIKNTSSRLPETFRNKPISNEDVRYIEIYTLVYLE